MKKFVGIVKSDPQYIKEVSNAKEHVHRQKAVHSFVQENFNFLNRRSGTVMTTTTKRPVQMDIVPRKVSKAEVQEVLMNAIEEQKKNPLPKEVYNEAEVLRSNNYWNAFFTEEAGDPALRSNKLNERYILEGLLEDSDKTLIDVITLDIKPDSPLYDSIFELKNVSPRLLYIVNEDE